MSSEAMHSYEKKAGEKKTRLADSPQCERVFISIGSNEGEKHLNVCGAIDALGLLDVTEIKSVSSLYRTEPCGHVSDSWFINCVVELKTMLPPLELLDRVEEIEVNLGRKNKRGNEPRSVDLDIVLYGDLIVRFPRLCVPHPRMAKRRFVLEPLAEIAPNVVHPLLKSTASDLNSKTLGQKVFREELYNA
ncbi:MAG: 2-amino-4-hydroxy-6-hydroxymethyldihydropteridine diphosphokinase [Nitrospinota bacterium]